MQIASKDIQRGFASTARMKFEEREMHSIQIIYPEPFSKRSQRGQDLAEYGLLIALIALAVIAGVTAFGLRLGAGYQYIIDRLAAVF
jgi:Flp pilus assembly pilin Flp